MQSAKPHRYVSALGPNPHYALAVAENEGWRIPPIDGSTTGKRKGDTPFLEARRRSVQARAFEYGDHG